MTNRFAGRCAKCSTNVTPGAGIASKNGHQWIVVHVTCPVLDSDDIAYDAWVDHEAEANAVTEPGMYELPDGDLAKVQISKQSGRPYAKRLVIVPGESKGTFEYEAGLIRHLAIADRLSLGDAVAFGLKYGMCCVCGATLTDPASVAAGIGPICIKRI